MPLPESVLSFLKRVLAWRDRRRLQALPTIPCDPAALRVIAPEWVAEALGSAPIAAEWPSVLREIEGMGFARSDGGVNPGDRRALYHLVRALRPGRVLEVGTHIGASTVHVAAALRAGPDATARLTTVDLLDVNDATGRPWLRYGASHAPRTLVDRMGMAGRVEFVNRPSLDFLAAEGPRYDLIFLDGDHSAATVYRELPAALRRLTPGGVVLLHDYFPGGRPLWSNGVVIEGPWLATERLRREAPALRVVPLGALPWPTKLGSSVTSLALATRVP